MRWIKKDIWKACIALAGLLLLLLVMVWVPVSAGAYEGMSGTAIAGPMQATPTVDPTMAALQKEQLTQQVRQLDNWWLYWLYNGSTAFIAAFATVIVALFGIYQWAGNRKKDLRAQADERFKTAVTALGDEKESIQVGGAILLRSFLNKGDKKMYGRYYTQIFDLAVAYLRLSNTSQLSEDPDGLPQQPVDPNAPLPLTPLRNALIVVFKEAFPLARKQIKKRHLFYPISEFSFLRRIKARLSEKAIPEWSSLQSLDATYIQLDNAYLKSADLKEVWMPQASLREANLWDANLRRANLSNANLSGAILHGATLSGANLCEADLSNAKLSDVDLRRANLSNANLSGANLGWAALNDTNLTGANLTGADLKADLGGASLMNADLNGADLTGARLYRAFLLSANLTNANLTRADLDEAGLTKADLSGTNIEGVFSMKGTYLLSVKGLTKEQLEACKAKGAIIDEDTTVSASQPPVSLPVPSQNNDGQAPSTPLAQVNTPPPSTDGSSSSATQPSAEP